MYHRFEENKYPSTNIRIDDFKEHIKILKKEIKFVNPKNFENELKNNKLQRKILLTLMMAFCHFMKMLGQYLKKKKYLLFYL